MAKRTRKMVSVAAGLTAVLAISLVVWAQTKAAIRINGSTTVGPIADAFAEVFKDKYDISVKKTGSGDGAAALVDGTCDIATMSRFMKIDEYKKSVEKGIMPCCHTIAYDAVVPIVHPSNPVKTITITKLHDIYAGKITNWRDLGGPDKEIVVISRDTSSGTYETFVHFVMGKDKMGEKVQTVTGSPDMHARISSTDGSIGYVGLGFIDEKVKALEVNDVPANTKTIMGGEFPMARPLFMFTNGYPVMGSPVFKFITFALSPEGQEILSKKGFVPMTKY